MGQVERPTAESSEVGEADGGDGGGSSNADAGDPIARLEGQIDGENSRQKVAADAEHLRGEVEKVCCAPLPWLSIDTFAVD